jgi:uncharacterized protein
VPGRPSAGANVLWDGRIGAEVFPSVPLSLGGGGHAVLIAAEGGKFGLHLLVSTQWPQKVHDNVLTQYDNLVLMRMNSGTDLAHLIEPFRARRGARGRQVLAHPTLVRFGARISEEGGVDISPKS